MYIWSTLFAGLALASALIALFEPTRSLTPVLWILAGSCLILAALALLGPRHRATTRRMF